MILSQQILALLFSFSWGLIYYFCFYKLFKFLVYSKLKVLYNSIFHLFMSTGFFWGLVQINGGILHIYLLLFVCVGVLFARFILGFFKCQI